MRNTITIVVLTEIEIMFHWKSSLLPIKIKKWHHFHWFLCNIFNIIKYCKIIVKIGYKIWLKRHINHIFWLKFACHLPNSWHWSSQRLRCCSNNDFKLGWKSKTINTSPLNTKTSLQLSKKRVHHSITVL